MTHYYKIIDKRTDQKVIFEGYYASIKDCVETAISKDINLSYSDLSNLDLSNANLDNGCFIGASFENSNLSDANMSECDFTNANLSKSDLENACLALSVCYNTNFTGAFFNQTDVTDSLVKKCIFSDLSAMGIKWQRCRIFTQNIYTLPCHIDVSMSTAPVFIQGLPQNLVFLDDIILIGTGSLSYEDLDKCDARYLRSLYGDDIAKYPSAHKHYRQHRNIAAIE